MTPKEKAEDLLYQMRCDHMDGISTKKKARRCAKIAVDEILDVLNGEEFSRNVIVFWTFVKQEIDKL